MIGTHLRAQAAAHAVGGFQGESAGALEVARKGGAHSNALPTHGALGEIALRTRHAHVLGKLRMRLQRGEQQLVLLHKDAAALLRVGAARLVEGALKVGDLL